MHDIEGNIEKFNPEEDGVALCFDKLVLRQAQYDATRMAPHGVTSSEIDS
ncbi:hypothetical protein WG906_14155 [Pedobacter sp. P351]